MSKNIVICCDGTGKEYGDNNTNVVKLFSLIEKKTAGQIAYYDPGVGTFGSPLALTRVAKSFTKLFGLALGYGITINIEDAYEYLMDKYEKGDKIFLFGFSRGAFTVRALAGMLNKCGLLQKGSNNLIPYASRIYHKAPKHLADGFKDTFSRECKPCFIGVWDTVKSVGLLLPRKFPNAKLNEDVSHGYHALAIDERRSKFRANLWDKPPANSKQTIEQVWFAGVHSDIGGGAYKDDRLSNITLKWMIEKAVLCDLKIKNYKLIEIDDNHMGKLHNSLLPVWWMLGWRKRKIAAGSLIHESVYKRISEKKGYRPGNLPPKNECQEVR